jgi:hypothetical protein
VGAVEVRSAGNVRPKCFPARFDRRARGSRPLLVIAKTSSGQARRVADLLLAWHNAEENGGWDPVDPWQLDTQDRSGHSPGDRIHSRRTSSIPTTLALPPRSQTFGNCA